MRLGTRRKLIAFDKKRNELEERRGKLTWNVWHGRKDDRGLLDQVTREIAELPDKMDYYRTLLMAASETSGDLQKREVEVRFTEAMYNAVRLNPTVLEALRKAKDEYNAFRYEFAGVEMTEGEMVRAWQTERDPIMSLAMHITCMEQSAQLKETVLKVVRLMNKEARAAGEKLGVDITSFAELILERNDISGSQAARRYQELLDATDNITEFIENVRMATGEERITPLNDLRVVDGFIEGSGFYDIFPVGPDALEFVKFVLARCGFGEYMNLDRLGEEPYLIDLNVGPEAEGEAVTLSFGRGRRDYAMMISPFKAKSARDYNALLFHETGHLMHYEGMEQGKLPDFFKTDTEAFREAMAITMESLITDPAVIASMGNFHQEDMQNAFLFSRFLDIAMMRKFATGALFEAELYTRPEGELDALYADIYRKNAIVSLLPEVDDKVIGGSWAADSIYALMPGSRLEYGLGYAIASSVMSSLVAAGNGTAVHEDTARILTEHCYTGPELPWPLRINKLMQDMGVMERELLH